MSDFDLFASVVGPPTYLKVVEVDVATGGISSFTDFGRVCDRRERVSDATMASCSDLEGDETTPEYPVCFRSVGSFLAVSQRRFPPASCSRWLAGSSSLLTAPAITALSALTLVIVVSVISCLEF